MRQYLSNRPGEVTRILGKDSSRLAEVLIEITELVLGEEKIVGWRPQESRDVAAL
jgi:hypothetical protein